MDLVIVESPTKAKTLGRFLGPDYGVEATMGHIKDLPKSKLGIAVENNFKPDFEEVEKKSDIIKKIRSDGKKAKIIYLATDPDREGEAIAQHVSEILKAGTKTKRVAFHEITKEAVESAIASPRGIDKNLVDAQIARRVLDRLVGYKLSPLLWKKVRIGLSAGRVQSVAVRLIVEKEREIKAFKSQEYWEIFSTVKELKNKKEFTVQLIDQDVKDKKTADRITDELGKAKYSVSDVRKKEVTKNPYPPFTTSTMTQAAARIFGWSSKRTMSIAQKLYEEGLITYHRTDSFNLSAAAVSTLRNYIGKEFGEKYLPSAPKLYKTQSKVAQEAHEAIRPTGINHKFEVTDDKWAKDEETLYKLIWARFVACQMAASVYDETTIDVSAGDYLLRAGGQVMKFDGWRKVIPAKLDSERAVVLPEVSKGEKLDLVKNWSEQKFTQPPARFNEASLIKTLEKLGIGRPSTYAPTISTIQIRNYVEKDENKRFAPTPVGISVNDFLIGNFPDIFEYAFTAEMEDSLDKIADGKLLWTKTITAFYGPFEKKLGSVEKNAKRVKIEVEKLGIKCPECGTGELVVRTGRFGKFISCSRFPECKYTAKYLEKIGVKCPECKTGDVIIKKTGKGRKFFGCSRYPDCKWASWRSPKKEDSGEIKNET
ncbi:MAG: topoisomerase protein [Microgenomates group bacterium GW2011_GWC1_43_13]|uniref:DNA topoisomerase 1 n=3 Tax=Candidatus Woeseibacteriota TaxID=1752722 RepID=A0A837ICX6_9BACT|nr:MAG: topoisomerase protein [Microgenomates group bacterium GW2011_GWC1_43_13]KKT33224.1 MAG: topoisomerase protein [Candidatus Woesebacteria bacterium GW2011_GWB1_44_11]KKT54374.1 MAG: topoisomerase protein [Candidatus Woesebacteria bacterium GW2011_GWA1_44_23]OGM75840.1 MAG: DNA topoisomerase I [Candidatus Woesebacteria bacterium RIFOXYA1_FULL_43_16]OGM83340.1 MAG: DNA topoisomerase I [Candidatus Woesebacteria bacterium RIFOXYB1_FULL_42_36]OGM83545.1 MAG: DNA topoisomerase I [Candidatus Wo